MVSVETAVSPWFPLAGDLKGVCVLGRSVSLSWTDLGAIAEILFGLGVSGQTGGPVIFAFDWPAGEGNFA